MAPPSLAWGPMETSPRPGPTDVAGVLRALLTDPGRPRLTWYGDDHERVELSGAVLDNWVSKTTNLLVEELDAAPGSRVHVDLPPHWRTVLWALAAWRTGACVALDAPADVVVTDRPAEHAGAADVVAVSLPALARTFAGTLPPGALDAAASVMTYGDRIGYAPPTDPSAPALAGDGPDVTHRDLVATAAAALADAPLAPPADGTDAPRVALPAAGPVREVLLRVLGVLAHGGSVVLLAPSVLADDARTARLLDDERVTARPV